MLHPFKVEGYLISFEIQNLREDAVSQDQKEKQTDKNPLCYHIQKPLITFKDMVFCYEKLLILQCQNSKTFVSSLTN